MMICGSASAMGKQVFDALTAQKVFGESDEEQIKKIEEQKISGDILMELWGE